MSELTAELAGRYKIADPRPEFCSACGASHTDETRYVDFQAVFDAGQFRTGDDLHYIAGSDDLFVCERCIRQAAEVLELRPDLHTAQVRKIRQSEITAEHYRELSEQLTAALARAQEIPAEHKVRRTTRRKAA